MPTTSAMAGVPASNFQGSSFQLVPSSRTERIISPPVRNGGIASSSSRRPHRAPAPDGPHSLWPENARKSASMACTSTGRCGTDCAPSTRMTPPSPCTQSASSRIGLIVPSELDWSTTASSLTLPAFAISSSSSSFSSPCWSMCTYRNSAPVAFASTCHGTRFEWCSISVVTITSPGPRLVRPYEYATRLIASVVSRVKITSRSDGAFTRSRTFLRVPSNASVASTPSW